MNSETVSPLGYLFCGERPSVDWHLYIHAKAAHLPAIVQTSPSPIAPHDFQLSKILHLGKRDSIIHTAAKTNVVQHAHLSLREVSGDLT